MEEFSSPQGEEHSHWECFKVQGGSPEGTHLMYVDTEALAASTSTHTAAEESEVSTLSETEDALLPTHPAPSCALSHGLRELNIYYVLAGPCPSLHLTVSCLDSPPVLLE